MIKISKDLTKKNQNAPYFFKYNFGKNPITGEPIASTSRGHKTIAEAEEAYIEIKKSVRNGTYHRKPSETFEDVYNLWLPIYKTTVEESTFVKTKGIFKKHILPALGKYMIEKISVDVCQQHFIEWAKKIKGYNKIKNYASMVVNFAIARDLIAKNPFDYVIIPKNINNSTKNTSINFYEKDQLLNFLNCAEREENTCAYVLFRLLSFSGMRKSEALSLSWTEINFENNTIDIHKALSKGEKSLYIKSTKTGNRRILAMDSETMNILKNWKKLQQIQYLKLGFNTNTPNQLVFSNTCNSYLQPSITTKWLNHILKKYNLPKITTHNFRHTNCSLYFESGAKDIDIQYRLGHSDIRTTKNIYTFLSDNSKKGAVSKFESFMAV